MANRARALLRYGVLLVVIAAPLEILSFAAAKLLTAQALLYDPPEVEDFATYLRERDPLLGWPSRRILREPQYDGSGARAAPLFPSPASPSCVALFGDSYTWGDEVSAEHSYGNVLAGLLGC